MTNNSSEKNSSKKQRFRDIKQKRVSQVGNKNDPRVLHRHASKANRIKAVITDSFMLVMPLTYIVFYFIFEGREGFGEHKMLGWIYILLPLIIIQILFMAKSKYGQTPGMRAYNLALIDLKTREKPKTGIIVYRQMLSLLSFFVLGWITMFFRKDCRTLHELLSDTTLRYIPEQDNKVNKKHQ